MIKTGVSYYGPRSLPHVEADMAAIKANHVSYVVHTFSENDFMFYRQTMKDIFDITRRQGLGVHADPWGLLGIFGGEAFSDFVSFQTDVRQVLSDKRSGAAACPNHPDTLKFMKKWVDAAVEAGADVIFWDEPHFYMPGRFGRSESRTVWGCLCDYCRAKYKRMYRKNMTAKKTQIQKIYIYAHQNNTILFIRILIPQIWFSIRRRGY